MTRLSRPLSGLALALAAVSSAAAAGDYTGPVWARLDLKQVMAAAAAITPAAYPNCDDATVDQKSVRVYRADGTAESQDECFTKVLTEKGQEEDRTISLSYMIPYDTVSVPLLEVIHPDGRITPVDVAANSKDSIDDSQMEENIYDPNSRVLSVNIPDLQPGDVVHSVQRDTVERPIMPGEFAEENVLEGTGYIRHMSYEVRAPAAAPLLHTVLRDPVPGTVAETTRTEADGTRVYHWEIDRVPRMYDEPSMPPYEMVLQRLLVSDLPDWPAVSRWYWNLSRPHLEATSPEMRRTVDQLVAGKTDPMERIKALFYYVSKNIRYMGITPEKDRPGFEPHDVRLTFAKKYGVCRDKAALLVEMLRMAGFRAYPVLENFGSRKDPAVPDPFFDHAIAAVSLQPGRYVLMDPTDENTRQLLPADEDNQSYLVCTPEGDGIRLTPVESPDRNMMLIRTTGSLDGAGRLRAQSELSFEGINDNAYRAAFARMKPDDEWRFFESCLKRAMPSARLTGLAVTPENMLDLSQPVHARISFVVDGMVARGQGKAVVTLPWLGGTLGIVGFVLHDTGLARRKYPLETEVACGVSDRLSLKLDRGFDGVVSLPSCAPVDDPGKSYAESVSYRDGVLTGSREFKLKTVEFSPAEYLALKRTLEALAYDERKKPVLTTTGAPPPAAPAAASAGEAPVESDVRILAQDKTIAAQDAHDETVTLHTKEQILTYNGKKADSEVKITYNPSCEQATILRAVVTSKSGQVQEISPDEINLMDAPGSASARRYTGDKVLVASLPGVEIGSTVEYEARITVRDKPYLGGYELFQFTNELSRATLRITAPAGLAVHWRDTGSPGIVREETGGAGGGQSFAWTAEDVAALPSERDLPPAWIFAGGVASFIGDPAAYLRALDQAMTERAAHAAKAGAEARRLAAAAPDRLAAVRAIRDYVDRAIRLAGPSYDELPLSQLSDADTTLAEGYGNLADRGILLRAMLAAAGFQPQMLLASDLPAVPRIARFATSFPLPDAFNQPLVRVVVDGQAYILNDTDQYSRLGSTPHDGRLAIALPGRTYETIEAAPGCRTGTDSTTTISLADDGTARIGIAYRYYGDDYNAKNRFFSQLPPEERRLYFEQAVSGIAQGARPVGGLVTDFDHYPGTESFTVEIDHYAVVDGKTFYFDLPFTPTLLPARTDRRDLPLYIPERRSNAIHAVITLPPGYRRVAIAPQPERWEEPDGAGEAVISAAESGGRCVLDYRLDVAPAIVFPGDYPTLVATEAALESRSARIFLLEAGAP